MMRIVRSTGARLGLVYDFDGVQDTNTLLAHQLLQHAKAHGMQDAMLRPILGVTQARTSRVRLRPVGGQGCRRRASASAGAELRQGGSHLFQSGPVRIGVGIARSGLAWGLGPGTLLGSATAAIVAASAGRVARPSGCSGCSRPGQPVRRRWHGMQNRACGRISSRSSGMLAVQRSQVP